MNGRSMRARHSSSTGATGAPTPFALPAAAGFAWLAGACLALVGDLTAQHDLTALAAAKGRDIIVVVLNNGGGGIFDYLPVAALPEFERGWLTPQTVDLVAAAHSFGVVGERVWSLAELTASVERALRRGGATLIEVPIDRRASVAARREFSRQVTEALL